MAIWVDNTLYYGRPNSKREENEIRCYDVLDLLHISYERVDHDPADTIEDCHYIENILGHSICKNLFLSNRQETDFYLLLLPGDKPFKTKQLSTQLGTSRLSFAKPEKMTEYLDILPGSVSIFGIINDISHHVKLIIDKEILDDDYICCHPCRNTSTLKIRTSDILEKLIPYTCHEYKAVALQREV